MSNARSSTPTLHDETVDSSRDNATYSKTATAESPDLANENIVEREAANTDVLRPAEGSGARLPAPVKFAHSGEWFLCLHFA